MTNVIIFNNPFSFFPLGLFLTMATTGEESSPSVTTPSLPTGSASSPQSEAVANELQELSLQPVPNLLPIHERKNGEFIIMPKQLHLNTKSKNTET